METINNKNKPKLPEGVEQKNRRDYIALAILIGLALVQIFLFTTLSGRVQGDMAGLGGVAIAMGGFVIVFFQISTILIAKDRKKFLVVLILSIVLPYIIGFMSSAGKFIFK
jgi:hypothetical protein